MIKNFKNQKGYTLVETLFYIALFIILSTAVINALITMTQAFKETTINAEFVQSSSIMERMSREIRQANGINYLNAGDLKLNTKDEAGPDKIIEFLLSGSNIQLLENSVLVGNLNTPNIEVVNVIFTELNTSKGKAVKIFLTVKSKRSPVARTADFYDTVVLRGDYFEEDEYEKRF